MINRARRILSLLMILMLCALCGCSFKNDVLDEQMAFVVSCLNDNNPDALYERIYPNSISKEEFLGGYEQLRSAWQPVEAETAKLVKFYVETTKSFKFSGKTHQGIYRLSFGEKPYYLTIDYLETDSGKGIAAIDLAPVTEVTTVEVSTASIISFASQLICLAFVFFTIVDIIRKKPGKYGWFIVLAFVPFWVSGFGLQVILPLGAMIYWCARKSLLRRKAERLAVAPEAAPDAEQVPSIPDSGEQND